MRKITLFIASLLVTMGAMAQNYVTEIDTDKYYTLRCTATDHPQFIADNDGVFNGRSAQGTLFVFEAVEGQENTYYIKSALSGKYLGADGETDTPLAWTMTVHTSFTKYNGEAVSFDKGSKNYLNNNETGTGTNGLMTRNHGTISDGNGCSLWYLTEYILDEYIEEWKAASKSLIGNYVGCYPESLSDDIDNVSTYAGTVDFDKEHAADKVALSTDAYYRLVCVSPKTGNNGDTTYNTLKFDGKGNLVTSPTSASNVNQLFQFVDAGEGKYYLKNLNAGKYLNKINQGGYRSAVVDEADACKLDLQAHTVANQWKLHNSESSNAMHCLFAENEPSATVPYACSGWDNGANSASAWYIVPVTELEMIITGFASICLPFDVQLGEGVKAYAIESTNSTHAILAEKADVPAGEGAILEGNGTVALNLAAATDNWDANMLAGTFVDTYIEGTAYVLANGENGVGLYKASLNKNEAGEDVEENGTHFKNNANKAYLVVEGANAPMFSFTRGDEEDTTGIELISNDGELVVYDLTGRRVEKMEKGIYIVNGRKVVIK